MLNYLKTKFFKLKYRIYNLSYKAIGGFIIGILIASMFFSITAKTEAQIITKYIQVPVPVEKPTIVKVPVRLTSHDKNQIQCLAENTYFEAGNQSRLGMIAVNNVVMNRVKDGRFAQTPCGVIAEKHSGTCQFSWKCEGHKLVRNREVFNKAREVAVSVYLGNVGDVTHGAQFYHANYVKPSWAYTFNRTRTIGSHIFYRG